MNVTLWQEVGAVAGMGITGLFGYLAARRSGKKDDRQLLSEDERHFRSELKDMMTTYQSQVTELTTEVGRLTKSNIALEGKVQKLTAQNETLTLQVFDLTTANNQLREELRRRQ